ncbi:hypothetical protein JCM11251_002671 [Rhodosporidiobolus azoricus]
MERQPSQDAQSPSEDGPLFRAHLASLEKRSTSIRNGLKKLQKAVEASLAALQANAAAQATVDDALEELGTASLTSQSEVLGALYERELRGWRDDARAKAHGELARGKELSERIKGAVERIKVVEERRKAFEADSKKYYDELAKYLSRGADSDLTKTAAHDSKQAERAALFRQQRIEYFAFLEGLVESEEGAVASWLRTWADAQGGEEGRQRDQARQASLDALEGLQPPRELGRGRGFAGSSKDGWVHVDGLPDFVDPDSIAVGGATAVETDLGGPSSSGFSNHAVVGEPSAASPATSSDDKAARRRRRSSIPHFHVPGAGTAGNERERENSAGGTRDRLKGFLRSATSSIQSALPASASSPNLPADLFRRPSPPPPLPSPPLGSHGPKCPPGAGIPNSDPIPYPPASAPASAHPSACPSHPTAAHTQLRRKEGFLFATETGQKHTTAGDGGAKWARYWVTLAEGQLVEYDKWQDVMSVHGSPINLRYATARISKNTDRRFSFEVLTPQLRRVFQAASEKECEEWVAAISRSIESLLQGTSSVRHFDASRLTGNSTPYSLDEFGSSTSLVRLAGSSSPPPGEPHTSPKSRLPDFLSRRSSLGHSRKISTSKKDKRRSVQSPPIPSLTIGEETARRAAEYGAPVDRSFFDPSSRRGLFAFSEGVEAPEPPAGAARPSLNGLGIPFPAYGGAASKSSPDLLSAVVSTGQRSASAPFPGSSAYSASGEVSSGETASTADEHYSLRRHNGEEEPAESASQLSAQDRAITEAVRGWASSDENGVTPSSIATHSAQSHEIAKYRNAARITEIAARGGDEWQNDRCADCREEGPRWASWSLGITLCIRCSGVHRSLGTHVSKVRSIELDDWNDEQVAQMDAVGNARSNAYFEARLPAGTVEALTDATIASFIREKYSDKRWTPLPSADSSAAHASVFPEAHALTRAAV